MTESWELKFNLISITSLMFWGRKINFFQTMSLWKIRGTFTKIVIDSILQQFPYNKQQLLTPPPPPTKKSNENNEYFLIYKFIYNILFIN